MKRDIERKRLWFERNEWWCPLCLFGEGIGGSGMELPYRII